MMRTCVRLAAPLLVTALVGCSVVDDFSGRAVDFNMQAEQVQEQTMLLNVVRASMRRPMQFTGLQSITGSASISGNGSLSFPFGPPSHRPPKSLSPDVLGLGGTLSGGPSFIVPVLDTQEFYEGILNPISLQVFDYYLETGFPPEVLFDLFVSKVVVTWVRDDAPPGTGTGTDTNCAKGTSNTNNGGLGLAPNGALPTCLDVTYLNSVANDSDFDQFQAIVDLLFAEGLSTEHIENISRYGAPLAAKNLQPTDGADNGRQAAELIQAYAAASQAGLRVTKAGQDYQLEKNTTSYRFCFRDFGAIPKDSSLLCGRSKKEQEDELEQRSAAGGRNVLQTGQGEVNAGGSTGFNLTLSAQAQQTLSSRLQQATARISPKAVPLANMHVTSFQLQLRSTEGIIYYLGELTRRHLYPEPGKFPDESQPRVIKVPTQVPDGAMPRTSCEGDNVDRTHHTELVYPNEKADPTGASRGPASSYFCDDIFVVNQGGDNTAFITVGYDGGSYGLAQGSNRSGRTYQVLELAKQILAVNTSAKQLPATSVVVISQP
ncbi:MAG TPA: hypothetical protein VHX19_10790 [Stellaceae bacterium]|jgi:hypothetical protein|nr:hypothetical protein [Stellaceae bacterium]